MAVARPLPVDANEEALIAQAERALRELGETYASQLGDDVAGMRGLCRKLGAAPASAQGDLVGALYGFAHDLKGQGCTFGFDLVTRVCEQLTRLLRGRRALAPEELALVLHHVDALELVHAHRMTGDGGPEGRAIVDRLRDLVSGAVAAR